MHRLVGILVVGMVSPHFVMGSVIGVVANGVVPHRVGNWNWDELCSVNVNSCGGGACL